MDLNKILEVYKGGFSPDLGVLKGEKLKSCSGRHKTKI